MRCPPCVSIGQLRSACEYFIIPFSTKTIKSFNLGKLWWICRSVLVKQISVNYIFVALVIMKTITYKFSSNEKLKLIDCCFFLIKYYLITEKIIHFKNSFGNFYPLISSYMCSVQSVYIDFLITFIFSNEFFIRKPY